MAKNLLFFDLETTSKYPNEARIIEIGAVDQQNGEFSALVNPGVVIPEEISYLTGIQPQELQTAPPLREVLPKFLTLAQGKILVAHNAKAYDVIVLTAEAKRLGIDVEFQWIDTLSIARKYLAEEVQIVYDGERSRFTLGNLCKHFGIELRGAHRALADVYAMKELYERHLRPLCVNDGFNPIGFYQHQAKKKKATA